MKYTGFIDKNGKKIYDGDMVKGNTNTHTIKGCIFLQKKDWDKKPRWRVRVDYMFLDNKWKTNDVDPEKRSSYYLDYHIKGNKILYYEVID